MRIGDFVKRYIREVFDYCESSDHAEFERLQDAAYSKKAFDVNFPFCTLVSEISREESKRYWTPVYVVRGKSVRVTSQWFDSHVSKSRQLFTQYLLGKRIADKAALEGVPFRKPPIEIARKASTASRRVNARYRGNAIGNAQNFVIRNILSNLGEESFSDKNWAETIRYFDNCCAYCGSADELVMDHVVPINRQSLGEHRLGNLVPSCRRCNAEKADKDFRVFLGDKPERIERIERYMDDRNYVPLGDNEQVRKILDMAYEDVSAVAERYLKILNALLVHN